MTEDSTTTIIHPTPRRPFELSPISTESSTPATPTRQPSESTRTEPDSVVEHATRHTRSILNLTSSTLFGIYSPGYDSNREEPSTPGVTGTQTPVRQIADDKNPPVIGAYERLQTRKSHSHQHQRHSSLWGYVLPLALRTVLLFSFGVAYGVIVSHLHDSRQVAPVQIEGVERWSWAYLMGWGGVGVLLGGLLPWVDVLWEEVLGGTRDVFASRAIPNDTASLSGVDDEDERPSSRSGSGLGADWNPVVRSIGAFIGIAFAIVS